MKLKQIFNNPFMPFIYIIEKTGFIRFSDEFYLKNFFKYKMGKKLNLHNPLTFNEKLQWLKLNDRKDIYTTMVDKYETKKYVANIIGEEHIIPTLAIYDSFDEIEFERLPNQFVIKCTHDSGGLIIVQNKDKLDKKKARKIINKSLKRNFYYYGREWPYKNVKPRIIVETFISDKKDIQINDYKFFCFNGKVKFFKVDVDRNIKHRANYFDCQMELMHFGEESCPPDYNRKIEMPSNIKEMIKLAEIMSKKIKFVRIDFYNVNGKIYFGEITFFPASGFGRFIPEEWDLKIGKNLNI